jgi:hypothetical protein
MARRKKADVKPTYFETLPIVTIDGFEINEGDMIKVKGQHGDRFKFIGLTKNNLTGSQWVDCFQIIGGVASTFRSFKEDQIKRIPQRGKRRSRVS